MPEHDRKRRRPYMPPEITRVELHIAEAVLGACKHPTLLGGKNGPTRACKRGATVCRALGS